MKKLIFVLIIIFLPQITFSQSAFLETGENGIMTGIIYSLNKDAKSPGFFLSFSSYGIFDFGLGISKIYFEEDEGEDENLNATSFTPYFTSHIIKPQENIPIGLAIGFSYSSENYSSDLLEEYNLEMKSNAFGIGGMLYNLFEISNEIVVIPNLGVSFFDGSFKISGIEDSISEDFDETIFSFSLDFGVKHEHNMISLLSIGIGISEEITTYSLSIGFVGIFENQIKK